MKNKITISLYWKCQLIGWSVAALYWEYRGLTGGHFNWLLGVLQFITDVFIYILLTHLYRAFAIKYGFQNLNLGQLLKRIVPCAIALGVLYTLATTVKLYLFQLWFTPHLSQTYGQFFKDHGEAIFIGGTRLMSIWLLAYHMYHYAQREIRTSRENARLAIISRDAQLNNLSAQLNPHFLFNSLNNIKALVIENPKSARRAIDLLSDLLRTSLYTGDDMLISLEDEISLVRDYLELEKLRFEERLQYEIHFDEHLAGIKVPRLSIQTLVENAIKHGIANLKEGGLITISVEGTFNGVKILVQNPGKLISDDSQKGVGLKNLEERLELQYKGRAGFVISDNLNDVVLATIIIPSA
ncbi:histidine kinase [Mucilaginibacter sp. BJC16-A38]|uniref:sensor histidine kinase n=1 Tax=Mucilaginibacter phenanthrenivorans TaxID=1234842 RepID=UPI00215723CA|nr:histidine kinase [Mucilaginibacter phenanthrenivorans]MCR8560507.1 histidine kinase [Mucilaginibacter phenanthrenivorans]